MMGSLRLWIALIAAQILVLIALAAAGSVTASTPALRYTGFACLAGIFVCLPPLVLQLFVAGQTRIGNGNQPMVRNIQQHQVGFTVGVWALIAVALALAMPRIRGDLLAENAAADSDTTNSVAISGSASEATLAITPTTTHTTPAPTSAIAGANAPSQNTSTGLSNRAPATAATAPTTATTAQTTAPTATTNDTIKLVIPAAGSKTRTAMLDALRQRLKMSGKFRVDHIRTWRRWGFVRATEVVELEKGEVQETDLTVAALLELPAGSKTGWWRIVELWTLPDDQTHPMKDFLTAIRAKQRRENLPAALFPEDLN